MQTHPCWNCGYLQGAVSLDQADACPECGATATALIAASVSAERRPRLTRSIRKQASLLRMSAILLILSPGILVGTGDLFGRTYQWVSLVIVALAGLALLWLCIRELIATLTALLGGESVAWKRRLCVLLVVGLGLLVTGVVLMLPARTANPFVLFELAPSPVAAETTFFRFIFFCVSAALWIVGGMLVLDILRGMKVAVRLLSAVFPVGPVDKARWSIIVLLAASALTVILMFLGFARDAHSEIIIAPLWIAYLCIVWFAVCMHKTCGDARRVWGVNEYVTG